jgi:hypothetical protein
MFVEIISKTQKRRKLKCVGGWLERMKKDETLSENWI